MSRRGRYIIFIASNESTKEVAILIEKILNISIIFREKHDDEEIYCFENYLDHSLCLNNSFGYLDIEELGLMFNSYQHELSVDFYTEPPSQEYLNLGEAERRVEADKYYSEKYNLMLKVIKFIFENLKSSRHFSLMLVESLEKKLDEFILNDFTDERIKTQDPDYPQT